MMVRSQLRSNRKKKKEELKPGSFLLWNVLDRSEAPQLSSSDVEKDSSTKDGDRGDDGKSIECFPQKTTPAPSINTSLETPQLSSIEDVEKDSSPKDEGEETGSRPRTSSQSLPQQTAPTSRISLEAPPLSSIGDAEKDSSTETIPFISEDSLVQEKASPEAYRRRGTQTDMRPLSVLACAGAAL